MPLWRHLVGWNDWWPPFFQRESDNDSLIWKVKCISYCGVFYKWTFKFLLLWPCLIPYYAFKCLSWFLFMDSFCNSPSPCLYWLSCQRPYTQHIQYALCCNGFSRIYLNTDSASAEQIRDACLFSGSPIVMGQYSKLDPHSSDEKGGNCLPNIYTTKEISTLILPMHT